MTSLEMTLSRTASAKDTTTTTFIYQSETLWWRDSKAMKSTYGRPQQKERKKWTIWTIKIWH